MAVLIGLATDGWANDGGDDTAIGNGAGAGKGDAGMLFVFGKNSRCDGAWVQLGLFGLPMGGLWVVTGNEPGKLSGPTVLDIAC